MFGLLLLHDDKASFKNHMQTQKPCHSKYKIYSTSFYAEGCLKLGS